MMHALLMSIGLSSSLACVAETGAGLRLVELKDPVAGGVMKAAVFYPSTASGASTRMGPLDIPAAKDAPLQPGRHPVVLLSHGNGAGMFSHQDTASVLARQGFIVASVEHPGDNSRDKSGLGTDRVLIGRNLQLTALLDFLLVDDPILSAATDPARIGVAGFSAGGYTALLMIGAKPRLSLLKTYCARLPISPLCAGGGLVAASSPPLAAKADPRVLAAFVMAPVGAFFDRDSLATASKPVFLYSAANDTVLPAADNALMVEKALPNLTRHVQVPEADHFVFLTPCNPAMKSIAPPLCTDPPNVDRQAVHDALNRDAAAFFRKHLSEH